MMRWSGTYGILRGSRGPFPPATAMVAMVVLLLGGHVPNIYLEEPQVTQPTPDLFVCLSVSPSVISLLIFLQIIALAQQIW